MNRNIFQWQEIFDSPRAESCLIRQVSMFPRNGTRQHTAPKRCRMLRLSEIHALDEDGETLKVNLTLLLPGTEPPASPGDILIIDQKQYELKSVELCTTLSGDVVARKCVVK